MAIIKRGIVNITNNSPDANEFVGCCQTLEDGEYGFFIFDKKNNPMLPMIQYINGVLISNIHSFLKQKGYRVSRDGLYKFFEEKFSEPVTEKIGDDVITYYNMKKLKTSELGDIADKIKQWGEKLGVSFPSRSEMKAPQYEQQHASVQADMWRNYKRNF